MKRFLSKTWPLLVFAAVGLAVWFNLHPSGWNSFKDPATVTMLKRFVAMKETQANAATNNLPPEIQALFKDAERGDWLTLSNSYSDLRARITYFDSLRYSTRHWHGYRGEVEDFLSYAVSLTGRHWEPKPPPRLQGTTGAAITEIYGAFEAFASGDDKYSTQFGREIIDSIPAGSIYFSGSDPGRFIVTAMCRSQPDGDPFFMLSQNALADTTYLEYLRSMYGQKIYIPTDADQKACSQSYAQASADGKNQNNGYIAIMEINALLVKIIFDKNPGQEFFIEGGYPLDWTYPYLEPHGLVFKINRHPVEKLPDDILQRDHDFWTSEVRPMIGGWLTDETPVKEIAAFAEKTFGRKDFSGFGGDSNFVQNNYTCSTFSRSRADIAGLYFWRAKNTPDETEKERMNRAADFAFRQAWALCPYAPEPFYNYLNFLLNANRYDEALLLTETVADLPQNKGNEQMVEVLAQVRQLWQKDHPSTPAK